MSVILVIDDEPNVIELCQRALEKEGFEVKGALSGEEGLWLFQGGGFDLTLLDINLPDRDGLDVLSTIQEMDPEMAVVIITGYGTMEVAIGALKAGAQDFLLKPFLPEELVTSVQKVLEKERLTQENLRLKARLPILEISKALMSEVNLERLPQLALETVQQALSTDRVSLMLLDEEEKELSILAALGLPDEVVVTTRMKMGQGLASLAAQRRKPILLPEQAESDPAIQAFLTRSDSGSAICMPLMLKDRVLGVLNASRPVSGALFRQDDVDLLSILGGQIAVAIENARLFEQAQQEIAERKRAEEALWVSHHFLEIANRHTEMIPLLDEFVSEVRRFTGCEAVGIRILDEAGNIPYWAYEGFSQKFCKVESSLSIKSDQGMCINVIKGEVEPGFSYYTKGGSFYMNGTTRFLAMISEKEKERIRSVCNEFGYVSVALVPIRLGDRILGLIHVADPRENMVPLEMVEVLEGAGIQLGTAIQRVRAEQALLRTERLAAMGRLAAALAHEVNNPLQAIGGSIELVLDFPLEEKERQEYLQAVRREIERLMALTGRVLDFAHPPQLERQLISVAEVVRYTLALAGKKLQHSHIQFSMDLPDDLPPVLASRDHLAQVFLNLVINAIEAMPDGGELNISAHLAGEQVELTFADSGPGISSDVLTRVFEPFYTTKEDGTGLGLAISHNIIQQHGGTITAGNAPGGGGVFTVALPLAPLDYPGWKEGE